MLALLHGDDRSPPYQVAKAKETEEKIDIELKELQATLANIEEARSFENLRVRGYIPCTGPAVLITCVGGRRRRRPPAPPRGRRDHAQEGQVGGSW